MKDKRAVRLKIKRCAERKAQKEAETKIIIDSFNDLCRKYGVKNDIWSKKDILKANNEIQLDLEREANMICAVATLYVMNRMFNYGAMRLYFLAQEIMLRITNAYNNERTAYQFEEEMQLDCQLYVRERFSEKPEFTGTIDHIEKANALWTSVSIILNIAMYAVYRKCNFKRKKMNELCDYTVKVIRFIIDKENLNDYRNALFKCGLHMTATGKIWVLPSIVSSYNTRYNWPDDDEILRVYAEISTIETSDEILINELDNAKRKAREIAKNCEKDSDGVRHDDEIRTAEYIAMLLNEAITARELEDNTLKCIKNIDTIEDDIKKGCPIKETASQKQVQPHYSTYMTVCQ